MSSADDDTLRAGDAASAEAALLDRHGEALVTIAHAAIAYGLDHGKAPSVDPASVRTELRQEGASFVTLYLQDALRGCVGSPRAWRPLATDVAANAYSAAFDDFRFAPLQPAEREALELSVTLLGAPQPMTVADEADLLRQLRPGVDGLILGDGDKRSLFLPQVWRTLPEPQAFVQQLKLKAGLAADHWSAQIRVERFTASTHRGERRSDPAAPA
jgi:AmmeMemoRadiSam system protein A